MLFYNTWPDKKLLGAEVHKPHHGDKPTGHARPHTNVPQTARQQIEVPLLNKQAWFEIPKIHASWDLSFIRCSILSAWPHACNFLLLIRSSTSVLARSRWHARVLYLPHCFSMWLDLFANPGSSCLVSFLWTRALSKSMFSALIHPHTPLGV